MDETLTERAFNGLDALGSLLSVEAQHPDFTSWTTADDIDAALHALEVLRSHFEHLR